MLDLYDEGRKWMPTSGTLATLPPELLHRIASFLRDARSLWNLAHTLRALLPVSGALHTFATVFRVHTMRELWPQPDLHTAFTKRHRFADPLVPGQAMHAMCHLLKRLDGIAGVRVAPLAELSELAPFLPRFVAVKQSVRTCLDRFDGFLDLLAREAKVVTSLDFPTHFAGRGDPGARKSVAASLANLNVCELVVQGDLIPDVKRVFKGMTRLRSLVLSYLDAVEETDIHWDYLNAAPRLKLLDFYSPDFARQPLEALAETVRVSTNLETVTFHLQYSTEETVRNLRTVTLARVVAASKAKGASARWDFSTELCAEGSVDRITWSRVKWL
ncbi:hypothetical protein BC830DRAFT_1175411 [Chytriomyces sp. MP71]|nr:hypothetical protein BC830DRAFT_1175411 [Chytriomyces sp. MP71]